MHPKSSYPRSLTLAALAATLFGFVLGRRSASSPSPSPSPSPTSTPTPTPTSQHERTSDEVSPFDKAASGITTPKSARGAKAKLLRFGEKRGLRWLGRLLQIQQRFGELQGGNVAAAVALQTFLSFFPMLLVGIAVVGFVTANKGDALIGDIISQSGLTGQAADTLRESLQKAASNRRSTTIVGFVTLLWSAIGISAALQYAFNQAWQVSPRGMKDKAIGIAWLGGASLLFVATMTATTLVRWLPAGASVLAIVVGMAISFLLWLFTAKVLPNVNVGWRALVPGAIVGMLGIEALKLLGALWVPKMVESSSGLYGTIGIVFAVLAWVILFGKLVVYSAVVNVVLHEGQHGTTVRTIRLPRNVGTNDTHISRAGTVANN